MSSASGQNLGRSGDWHVVLQPSGQMLLLTAGDTFEYRAEPGC